MITEISSPARSAPPKRKRPRSWGWTSWRDFRELWGYLLARFPRATRLRSWSSAGTAPPGSDRPRGTVPRRRIGYLGHIRSERRPGPRSAPGPLGSVPDSAEHLLAHYEAHCLDGLDKGPCPRSGVGVSLPHE